MGPPPTVPPPGRRSGRSPVTAPLGLRFDTEIITAGLRVAAGVAMLVMWAAGGLPRSHPAILAVALPLAMVYALGELVAVAALRRRTGEVAVRRYPAALTWTLTAADNVIILFVASLSGDVSSPVVAILLLVVTTNAARFGARLALAVAVADAGVLAVVCLAAPAPMTSLHHRLQLLGWWTWLLVGGAVIAGAIAHAALAAERATTAARRQVDDERALLAAERDARRKLEEEAADRRDFLRVVTHEVRTPITSLGALTRALTRSHDQLPPEDRAEMLELLQSHADHLEHLLRGVGDLATASTRTRPDRVTVTDLDLARVVASAAHAGGVDADRLVVRVETSPVRSDGEKLRRILTNLLENAGRHASGTIEVDARTDGGQLILQVADRGPGLRQDIAAQAFEKGFSFGPERGSSGLGLWIVRELAGVLGGRVWAKARAGGGLVVTVELPLTPGPTTGSAQAGTPGPSGPSGPSGASGLMPAPADAPAPAPASGGSAPGGSVGPGDVSCSPGTRR